MRLDKFFSSLGLLSRRECAASVKKGEISVDGITVASPSVHIDPEKNEIFMRGEQVLWKKHMYLMLNKPAGYVSSTEDSERTVMKLLPPEYEKAGCFPCGRLDIDTVGLLLITNDGALAHELLSPRRHVSKAYRFKCTDPLAEESISVLENGVDLGDFVSAPAKVRMNPSSDTDGIIIITEGKFHQIKRMLASVGSGIEFLERIRFGSLELDETLDRGQWRELTEKEIEDIRNTRSSVEQDKPAN